MNVNKISTVLFVIIFLLVSGGCMEKSDREVGSKDVKNNLCDIPESYVEFEKYFLEKYGNKIDQVIVEKLKKYFDVFVDKMVLDLIYSKEEKVRLIGFSKKCTALDGVEYEWQVAVTLKSDGKPLLHQLLLLYTFEDILSEKRDFHFERFYGSGKEFTQLLAKRTVGLLNKNEFDLYMKELGAEANEYVDNRYVYRIDNRNNTAARLALWDASRNVIVKYDKDNLVSWVKVGW